MEQIPDAVDTMPVTLRTQEAVYGLKKQADVLLKIGMVKWPSFLHTLNTLKVFMEETEKKYTHNLTMS